MRSGRVCCIAVALVAASALAFASGCGSSGASSGTTTTVHFAKTKFLLHAGLAFGAFHRYVYKPYRAGGFSPPSRHKAAIVKAGVATLFAYHETKLALHDARGSKVLSHLLAPILALQTRLGQLGPRLKGGSLDGAGINSANGAVSSLESASTAQGAPIADRAAPAP